jgi:hypothetical protein
MSLLQGVLRSHTSTTDTLDKRLKNINLNHTNPPNDKDESDDEQLVNVVSSPGATHRCILF